MEEENPALSSKAVKAAEPPAAKGSIRDLFGEGPAADKVRNFQVSSAAFLSQLKSFVDFLLTLELS